MVFFKVVVVGRWFLFPSGPRQISPLISQSHAFSSTIQALSHYQTIAFFAIGLHGFPTVESCDEFQ